MKLDTNITLPLANNMLGHCGNERGFVSYCVNYNDKDCKMNCSYVESKQQMGESISKIEDLVQERESCIEQLNGKGKKGGHFVK